MWYTTLVSCKLAKGGVGGDGCVIAIRKKKSPFVHYFLYRPTGTPVRGGGIVHSRVAPFPRVV